MALGIKPPMLFSRAAVGGCYLLLLAVYLLGLSAAAVVSADTSAGAKIKQQQTPRVLFLCVSYPNDPFGRQIVRVMQRAADDFSFELDVIYTTENNRVALRRVLQQLQGPYAPDYIIASYHNRIGRLLQASKQAGTQVVLINTPIGPSGSQPLGLPSGRHKNWLAAVVSDNFQTGFDTAEYLQLRQKNKSTPQTLVAINGDIYSLEAVERLRGLKSGLKGANDVNLLASYGRSWSADISVQALRDSISQHGFAELYWAASDAIALGVIDTMQREYQKKAGRDYSVVGMDWTEEGLRSIQRGELSASFGGHVFEGAWAMALINDHYRGVDFTGTNTLFNVPQRLAERDNVDLIYRLLYGDLFSVIDFKPFSRAENSALTGYDFSVQRLLEQTLEKAELAK